MALVSSTILDRCLARLVVSLAAHDPSCSSIRSERAQYSRGLAVAYPAALLRSRVSVLRATLRPRIGCVTLVIFCALRSRYTLRAFGILPPQLQIEPQLSCVPQLLFEICIF
jgi:hypothetical protein